MNRTWYFIIGSTAAVGLTGYLVWKLQKLRTTQIYQASQKFFFKILRWEERQVMKITERVQYLPVIKRHKKISWENLVEILLIGAWAFWVGRAYLNFDSTMIVNGREFSSAIQTHHLWTRFQECGLCALWNGSARGGHPAFVDVHGSMLHPLVILTTLALGVLNGAKLSLVIMFWMGGIAQWWIGKELGLGRTARMWTSALAVVAGHLSGRMELGAFGVMLSTAMASLVFGAILAVSKGKGNRAVVLLGVVLALTILAGQGYIQIGLLGTFPAILILVIDKKFHFKKTWKDFILAFILALLLSAIFLVPFLHFSPNFIKAVDADFEAAQPLKYIPLNYVIDSYDFYQSTALDKLPFPHLYVLFIGWIPVVLAVIGLSNQKLDPSIKWYFIASIAIILGISSGDLLRPISKVWEGMGGIRHPTQIAGLTVPLILGFAGLGLDSVLELDWPRLELRFDQPPNLEIRSLPTQILLVIPLVFSLHQGYQFAKHWIGTHNLSSEVYQVIDELKTDSLQWVQPPFGEHFYIEPAVSEGLKLSKGIMTWRWREREFPAAYLEASYAGQPPGTSDIVNKINTIGFYIRPEAEYAVVRDESGYTPCQASGTGGNIKVECDAPRNGRLVLKEYYWVGWKAKLDGKQIAIFGYPWLSLDIPAGQHTVILRYRPWDVPVGFALSLVGVLFSILIWRSSQPVSEKILHGKDTGKSE